MAQGAKGVRDISKAEARAKFGADLNTAVANPQRLLEAPKQNFTIPRLENERVAQGTDRLASQYQKEASRLAQVWEASPARFRAEISKLDEIYKARHADLIQGVGEFAPQLPRVSARSGSRPYAELQTQVEAAHNAGDKALEAKLVAKLPDQGMNPNATLTPERRAEVMARTGLTPPLPKVTAKKSLVTSIDPNDPFSNKNLLTRIRNEAGSLVDDDAQMIKLLRKVEKETGRKGLVDQWMFDTGNIRASNAVANAKLKNSPEFKAAVGGLSKKEVKGFDTYAAARAELKNYEGLPTSKAPEESAAIVAAGDANYGQRFESLNQFYKKQAQDMYEGGLISKERLNNYLASDDYIRIQRGMEDLVNPGFGSSHSRSIGSTTATQKRSGSAREVVSPTGTVPQRSQQVQLEIQRNKAATNTLDLLQELGLARRVPDTKNKNTISRLVEGRREVYEVPADIKKVMDNVNPYQLGVIARVISAPTRLFRAGTTALSAPFTVTNYLRDQTTSALYSKSILNTHNPVNIISGLASATRDFAGESQSPLWKKFEQFTGDQTIYDELRNAQNTKRLMREVRGGQAGKITNMITQPIRTLEDLNSITEKATRFQNFKGIYEKVLHDTGDEQEAIKAAVLAARQNSVDFQRSSSFTRALNLFIPYFNASVQGSRNVARSFRDRPVATSMKSVGLVALPSVALTAYNFSDEKRREAYQSISDFEKKNNFILVGPNPRQKEDGSWEGIYKIPKPQGYRELTDPVRDVTEAFLKGESVKNVAGIFKDMIGGLSGPIDTTDSKKLVGGLIPQAAKPWIQLGMNKDLYTGSDVVPEFMREETSDPTKRAYKGTSGSARLIAKQLGVSPIQVEKVIQDVAGSLGRYGINASDNALAAAGKIPKEQIGGRSIAKDFSRRLFEANGKLLERNKTAGRKYYENVKEVSQGLNKNELAAFNSLHPNKTNFLGEDIFDENKRITNYTRAGAYLNNPNVLEADRKLDTMQRQGGKPGNPLFDLPNPLLTKVLLKAALPPGSKDPELSNLYKESWYQDYQNARSKYYDSIKSSLAKEGKTIPKSNNPYPETPSELQKAMDAYSALPKGTGDRSSWIKTNPGLWQKMTAQWAQVDAWENKERVAIGLAPIENAPSNNSGGFGFGSGKKKKTAGSAYEYAVSPNAGGKGAKPKVSIKKAGGVHSAVSKVARPKVTSKRSSV
jgi:Heat-labile enterotoxin alpha chain.